MPETHAGQDTSTKTAVKRSITALGILVVGTVLFFWVVPENYYLWVKAGHVIAVISWMAGMLYLPRLFVYHAETIIGSEVSETFKIMERRLYRFIINPAMTVSWILGLWMAWRIFHFEGGWLHVKLALAVCLSAVHGYLGTALRRFAEDRNIRSTRHWRIINEVPTLLMILIVILVVVKPFA